MEITVINILTSQVKFTMRSNTSNIEVNDFKDPQLYHGLPQEIIQKLVLLHTIPSNCKVILDTKEITLVNDAVIAIYLTYFQECPIFLGEEELDLTFAHAFPIKQFSTNRNRIIKGIYDVVRFRQLVFIPSKELIWVDIPELSRSSNLELSKKRSKFLKHNNDVKITNSKNLSIIFDDWKIFCNTRFNDVIDPEIINFFIEFYENTDYIVKEFWDDSNCFCRSLLVYDHYNQRIYDVIAPWDINFYYRRPGIYSGLTNLLEAINLNYQYCLCYGIYSYKLEITGSIKLMD